MLINTYCSVWMRGRCIILQLYDNGERYIILKNSRLSSKPRPEAKQVWLTSQIQLSNLCFDQIEFDNERTEILDEGWRCHSVVNTFMPLILIVHLNHDRQRSLPGIFIKSLYLNHSVDREEKPLQRNLFPVFDHHYDFVNFTLCGDRINVKWT